MSPVITFNVEYLLEELAKLTDLPKLKEKIEKVKDFSFSFEWFLTLFELLKAVISQVQVFADDAGEIGSGTGEIKKKAIIAFLDKIIELPVAAVLRGMLSAYR